jgi:hypothetical protein
MRSLTTWCLNRQQSCGPSLGEMVTPCHVIVTSRRVCYIRSLFEIWFDHGVSPTQDARLKALLAQYQPNVTGFNGQGIMPSPIKCVARAGSCLGTYVPLMLDVDGLGQRVDYHPTPSGPQAALAKAIPRPRSTAPLVATRTCKSTTGSGTKAIPSANLAI